MQMIVLARILQEVLINGGAEFDETLVTGNDMIDSQHKELICKINQLLRAVSRRTG